jgi:hypothetical protein
MFKLIRLAIIIVPIIRQLMKLRQQIKTSR